MGYQRFSFGAGPSTRALLVRTCKMRGFDGLGRMVQVSCDARKRLVAPCQFVWGAKFCPVCSAAPALHVGFSAAQQRHSDCIHIAW